MKELRPRCFYCGRFIGHKDETEIVLVNSSKWPPYPGDQEIVHKKCKK